MKNVETSLYIIVAVETEVGRRDNYGLHNYSKADAKVLEAGAPNISLRLHAVLDLFQIRLLRHEVGRYEAVQECQTKHDQHANTILNLTRSFVIVEVFEGDPEDVKTEEKLQGNVGD